MSIYGAISPDSPKFAENSQQYDALLVLSFGGPEAIEDVLPFLENVTRGRGIPRERLEQVAEHYYHFGGVSPINGQNRALIAALDADFKANKLNLPIYFGNRNWHPFLTDTLAQMREDGIQNALVFITSAFSSYSGCRQYRENIIDACNTLGEGVPDFDKLRMFYNHPKFIQPMIEKTQAALAQFSPEEQAALQLVFTAHSIPMTMAANSDYEVQLHEACRLVAEGLGISNYRLVYQSRSGSPHSPWLAPDILDYMKEYHAQGHQNLVIMPIGFISDHMEVLFDLDTEAQDLAKELGLKLVRAETVGTHPLFIQMIRELIIERMSANPERPFWGSRGANHDICPFTCCTKGEEVRPRPVHSLT